MPGVNGICNTKMSSCRGNFELLLRRDVALRNFYIRLQKGTVDLPGWASESLGRIRYRGDRNGGTVLPTGD
jgi:hypothetical protein